MTSPISVTEEQKCFTYNYTGLAHSLKTPCTVLVPFDPIKEKDKPHHGIDCTAIWDTGATGSVISSRLATQLGLIPTSMTLVHHASGTSTQPVYKVNIALPNYTGFAYVNVSQGEFSEEFDVLIGMDIITQGDFSITNVGYNTMFSFRMPSLESIDYRNSKIATKSKSPIRQKRIGRNDPCPCNSGKKYKNCCGN